MYEIGDILISQEADTTFDEGPAGANQTWDFSDLAPAGVLTIQSIVTPSSTPFATDFPTADLAINDDTGSYTYFDVSGNDLYILGGAGPGVIFPLSNSEKFLSYPITYNSAFTDDMAGSYISSGITNSLSGTVNFLADGYGALILPSGTVNNVLRLKYTQDYTFTINFGLDSVTTTAESTGYLWMVEGNKNALVSIGYYTTSFVGELVTTKSVSYYPGSVSTEDLLPSNETIQLYPNPTTDKAIINVYLDRPGTADLSLYSTSGKQMRVIEFSNVPAGLYSRQVDLEDVEAGIYFLKLEIDDRNIFTRRIVKQ
jgi:hypothetical protein